MQLEMKAQSLLNAGYTINLLTVNNNVRYHSWIQSTVTW